MLETYSSIDRYEEKQALIVDYATANSYRFAITNPDEVTAFITGEWDVVRRWTPDSSAFGKLDKGLWRAGEIIINDDGTGSYEYLVNSLQGLEMIALIDKATTLDDYYAACTKDSSNMTWEVGSNGKVVLDGRSNWSGKVLKLSDSLFVLSDKCYIADSINVESLFAHSSTSGSYVHPVHLYEVNTYMNIWTEDTPSD